MPARHLTRPPADAHDLWYRVDETAHYAASASAWHEHRSTWWDVTDTWARPLIAVAAALTALSLVMANDVVTAGLAVSPP